MEEAYTIGIRLALEDGISASIAAIGAEMTALGRAATAEFGELQRLRSVGDVAAARPVAEAARQSTTPLAAVPLLDPVPAYVAEPRRPAVHASWEGAQVRASSWTDTPPSPPTVRQVPTVQQPPIAAVAPIATRATDAADSAAPRRTRMQPDPAEPWVLPAARPAPPAAPLVAPPMAIAIPQPTGETIRVGAPVRTATAPPAPTRGTASRAPAEQAVAGMPAPVGRAVPLRSEPTGSALSVEGAAAQGMARSGSGSAQGDIFLDGVRMGRWIVERMAREAGRPQGGSTGFDARMSPAWNATR